jgi:hypothetical protein
MVLLGSPGWPSTFNPPASAFWVLRLHYNTWPRSTIFFPFFVALEFELRTSCLLGRHSATWTIFAFVVFQIGVSYLCLNLNLPIYASQITGMTGMDCHTQLIGWDGGGLTNFLPAWLRISVLLISTSWEAGITSMNHAAHPISVTFYNLVFANPLSHPGTVPSLCAPKTGVKFQAPGQEHQKLPISLVLWSLLWTSYCEGAEYTLGPAGSARHSRKSTVAQPHQLHRYAAEASQKPALKKRGNTPNFHNCSPLLSKWKILTGASSKENA